MQGKRKPSKREAIIRAMLEVVTERGLHEASMSLVMERSGASAGVIYHHFASKEAILEAVCLQISRLKAENLLSFYRPGMDAREAFLHFGLHAYRFYREHPQELRFLQQIAAAGLPLRVEEGRTEEGIAADFEKLFRRQSEGGMLRDWPKAILTELTMGLIERLAALPEEVPEEILLDLGSHVWSTITVAVEK